MQSSFRSRLLSVLNLFLLIVFSFICFYPLYFVFINAFSSAHAITNGIYLLPKEFTLIYFSNLFSSSDIYSGIFISVARTVIGTAVTVFCSSLLGYMVTQKNLPFRKLIYRFTILTMYFNAGLIPWYMLMKSLGLKNNFLLYVLPTAISAFYVILVKTYVESLPPALEESAEIDGAGTLTIFFRLILPLSLPIIACLIVFCAVGQWNSWTDNLYLVTNPKLNTLQFLLYLDLQSNMANITTNSGNASSMLQQNKVTPTGLRFAMTVITVIPIILVYPFMQKYFVKGILLGAVKG